MLVLNRRPGQSIRIGDDIVLTVNSVRDGKVSLGVEAPREVNVYRSELLESRGRAPSSRMWCNRCNTVVSHLAYDYEYACCDHCATESQCRDDDDRYDGVDDIHEAD